MFGFWKKLKFWQKWGLIGFLFGTAAAGCLFCRRCDFIALFADFVPMILADKIANYRVAWEFWKFLTAILTIPYFTLLGVAIGQSFESGFKNKNRVAKILFSLLLFIFLLSILFLPLWFLCNFKMM